MRFSFGFGSILAGIAAAVVLGFSAPASAQTSVSDAIALCRTTVAQQAGVDLEHARFDQVRERSRLYSVAINLWSNGALTHVRCDVPKGETATVASITPALQTASAQR